MIVLAMAVMVVMLFRVLHSGIVRHVHLMGGVRRGPMCFSNPGNRKSQKQGEPSR